MSRKMQGMMINKGIDYNDHKSMSYGGIINYRHHDIE